MYKLKTCPNTNAFHKEVAFEKFHCFKMIDVPNLLPMKQALARILHNIHTISID